MESSKDHRSPFTPGFEHIPLDAESGAGRFLLAAGRPPIFHGASRLLGRRGSL
jgi:hypothetical protein